MGKITVQPERGPSPVLGISPVVIVGVNVDGRPDFTTVAWTGIAASRPPCISIALQHHRHSLKGIRQNMAFSVNIPSTAQARETDYCGLVSGAKADKAKDCRFTVFTGKLDVPLIEQCPVNHACEVVHMLNLGSHELVIGKIVETYISEDCLDGGRTDPRKINPIIMGERKYWALGELVAKAFRVGLDMKPGEKLDMLDELKPLPEITPKTE